MDLAEAMAALEKAGGEPARKALARAGARGPSFGVRTGDIERLARRAGKDPALAEALWRTGNHDARVLATMVDDGAALPMSRLEARAREIDRPLSAPFSTRLAAASPHAPALAERWTRDANDAVAEAGWHLVAALATRATPPASDAWFSARLLDAEGGLARAAATVRGPMSVALVAIGARSEALAAEALRVAKRVGSVEVETAEGQRRVLDAAPAIGKARAAAREREDRFGMKRDRA